jgi:hypothetical protein
MDREARKLDRSRLREEGQSVVCKDCFHGGRGRWGSLARNQVGDDLTSNRSVPFARRNDLEGSVLFEQGSRVRRPEDETVRTKAFQGSGNCEDTSSRYSIRRCTNGPVSRRTSRLTHHTSGQLGLALQHLSTKSQRVWRSRAGCWRVRAGPREGGRSRAD